MHLPFRITFIIIRFILKAFKRITSVIDRILYLPDYNIISRFVINFYIDPVASFMSHEGTSKR